ncbi:MAG: DUF1674 domain-containing protein [Proteobacteria bacterium]|nr:DUF1674 domain-containing protein [Pseudomonadota bacterium]
MNKPKRPEYSPEYSQEYSQEPSQKPRATDAIKGAGTHLAPGEKKNKKPGKPLPEKTETGGPKGLEPTRYGDWERKGRAIDF